MSRLYLSFLECKIEELFTILTNRNLTMSEQVRERIRDNISYYQEKYKEKTGQDYIIREERGNDE